MGTSDISILDCSDGVFEVLATNGDSLLGGKDIDEAIVKEIVEFGKKEYGVDFSKDIQALQRITEAAEKAKCELSSAMETTINLPFISMNANGPIHLNYDLSRAAFEKIVSKVYDKVENPAKKCIEDSGVDISKINDVILVGGTTRIPYLQELTKKIFQKTTLSKEVNPDEVVSTGACIQGAVLAGDTSAGDVVLLDVTSISYGIETEGGIMVKLIEANTTIPAKKSQIFSTAVDNQAAVSILVYQGESKMAKRNKLIGQFNLDGICPAPRGVPQIEVSFDIDANGILNVSALDKGTNKEQHITIQPNGGLSKEEIEKLKKEAELHAEEDNKAAANAEAKNHAESMIYQTEKQLKEHGDKVDQAIKDEIEAKLKAIKDVKDCGDAEKINAVIKDAEESLMKLGTAIYQAAQAASAASGNSGTNAGTNNTAETVDAEVVDE